MKFARGAMKAFKKTKKNIAKPGLHRELAVGLATGVLAEHLGKKEKKQNRG